MTGDEHYKRSEIMLTLAQMDDLPYEKAVIAANVAQTHALLAQIASARELGTIQQAGIDAFREANATSAETEHPEETKTYQMGFDDCALHLRKQLIQLRSSAITAERQDAYDKALLAIDAIGGVG